MNMLYYKIEAQITNIDDYAKVDADDKHCRLFQVKLKTYYEGRNHDCVCFISSIRYGRLMAGAFTNTPEGLDKEVGDFLKAAEIECAKVNTEETTFNAIKSLLDLSCRNDYIEDSDDILKMFGIECPRNYHNSIDFNEILLPEATKKSKLLKKSTQIMCSGSLAPELERIYSPARFIATGHPVHYIIQSDNDEVSSKMNSILASGLYRNKRLKSRRIGILDFDDFDGSSKRERDEFSNIYKICTGGAAVINLPKKFFGESDEGDTAPTEMEAIEFICRTALQYRNKVLTIIRLPSAAEKIKSAMREHLDTMSFIEIAEDRVCGKTARNYLKKIAHEHGVLSNKALFKDISDEERTYTASELRRDFNVWYDQQLKLCWYPQYSKVQSSIKSAAKEKPHGDAYTELEQLIGLTDAKDVIKQAIDYFKAQKLFSDRGMGSNRPAMHMVFAGSPGTAKTTVARLFAQIMKDNGILSQGGLVEVGRADLVGKYVGWTARQVESAFKKAMGSVLFIDEAYSLVDDRSGSFGDEAINTIVKEMENRRDDLIVIFAGYSDKMEEFMQKNPGLRSRIAFHVPFADYSSEELYEILSLIAKKQSVALADDVKDKLMPIIAEASRQTDFGNGRFTRNLYEKARMKQASRLLAMDVDNVTNEDILRLIADDFIAPSILPCSETRQIGFIA